MSDRRKLIAAILASLPALLLACSQWIKADAERKEKAAAYESYGNYVTDQLHRDEALLKALQDCQEHQRAKSWAELAKGPIVAYRAPEDVAEPQAQSVLDDVARSRGWEPGR